MFKTTKQEKKAYDRGYALGFIQGREDTIVANKNEIGCVGCAFICVEEWQMPCLKCKRNAKDYWRAKGA